MSESPEAGSNFSLAFLFLSSRQRGALRAVYAFCRHADDIVDSGAFPPQEAAKQLDFWREEVGRLYSGKASHPIALRLRPHILEFRLPQQAFLDILDGVRMDLEKTRYETFAELEKYLYVVAGAVGLLCVEIFGYRRTSAEEIRAFAVATGNAFQLTNILRDVGTDLERGRIYLPLEDIREAGYTVEAFIRRQHTAEFVRLMSKEHDRAKACYRQARNLLHPEDRASMTAAAVMSEIYEEILDNVKAENFRVFFQRVGISFWRKVVLACRGWCRAHGIY
ncbi:MAG: presqualene diphosphate synthase HpnD [Elusimicrobia bacterium]|nr:presqualene diphosphate synthase HpnD [Elusimicrobiota bacterium]